MIYDNFALANGFRRHYHQKPMKFGRHNLIRDLTLTARDSTLDNSRHAPEPVDHLTGKMVAECLDRIKALTDEREAIRAKLRDIAHQVGVDAPGDDPLAALDVIGQRCRDLSTICHHQPTTASDPMTAQQQRAARVATTVSRDDDDDSHVIQSRHATPPLSPSTPHLVTLPPSDNLASPSSPLPEWVNSRVSSASFTFDTMTTPPVMPVTHPSPRPRHPTPPAMASITHPATPTPSGAMTPPQPTPGRFRSTPRSITVGNQRQHRGGTSSPVLGAVGGQTPSPSAATAASPAPPAPAIVVWDVNQLSPFDRAKGDMVLGKGAFGTVRLYRDRATRTPLAVKTITLPSDPDQMVRKVQAIQNETDIQAVLGCQPYFPTYHGCIEMAVGEVGIAMEFVGDRVTGETMPLCKVLHTGSPVLSPKDWFSVANDLVQAIKFVHDTGYLHNDLKEDNVLLSRSGGRWRAVVIDFGWVSLQTDPQFFGFSDSVKAKYARENLYEHLAPECALLDEGTSTVSDVFQLGRLIRLIGARTGDKHLRKIGENCCHIMALYRSTVLEVNQELDRLAPSY